MPTVLIKTAHRCPYSPLVRWRCRLIHNADIGWMPGRFRRSKEALRRFSRSGVFGSASAGGPLCANDGTFHERRTVRKIRVICSTANQDSDGFLFSPLGSNMHKETPGRRSRFDERHNISLFGCSRCNERDTLFLFCSNRIVLGQFDSILAYTGLLKRLYRLVCVGAISKNAYNI